MAKLSLGLDAGRAGAAGAASILEIRRAVRG
jgi:hypothetical protein